MIGWLNALRRDSNLPLGTRGERAAAAMLRR